jgi:enoyl-CoA hydratase/carnithine racemase
MRGFTGQLRRLAVELDLELTPSGRPVNPVVTIDLDSWRDAPADFIQEAAGLAATALPITVGLLADPPTPDLAPLIAAVTMTFAAEPMTYPRTDDPAASNRTWADWPDRRAIIPVGDLSRAPDLTAPGLDHVVEQLRAAVLRSPRAAIACGQLVRQTAVLSTVEGLAAEAAVYSVLLSGEEFGRWLADRGAARAPSPIGEPVLVRRTGSRLSIMLNVPERRNAFSAGVREGLLEAVLLAEADETIKSVELSGAGPAFCSGGDLDEFGGATDLVAAWLVRLARAPWRVIDRIAPKVTVHAHGACVGAGTEVAAFAGRVVAAPDAFFALPEVHMGLVPGAGGSVSVVRRTGRQRAAWLMLTGERLPAVTALRWGLADEIAPRQAGHDHSGAPAAAG